MRSEYNHWLGLGQRRVFTHLSRWVVAVEKKEQDTGKALFGDDAAVDASCTMEARSLREGLPPLDLATIKDFLRFIIATSQGIIDDKQKKVTVDSMNTFAEWFFAGFARVTGNRIDEEDRCAVYDVSVCRRGIKCPQS